MSRRRFDPFEEELGGLPFESQDADADVLEQHLGLVQVMSVPS
jgi:hypothetical protein